MDGSSAQDGMTESNDVIRGTKRTASGPAGTVQALAAKTDVRRRAQHTSGLPGRLPDLARTAAGQAASITRKYPVRLVTVVTAALAGMVAGRRRRSG